MKRFSAFAGVALVAAFVTACRPAVTPPVVVDGMDAGSSSSVSVSGRSATVEGLLQKAGISMYMQGSHRLQMDDGTFLLLESSTLRLDDYLDMRVIVTGTVEPTVESGGMVMNVEMIDDASSLLEPEVLEEGSSSSAASSSSVRSSSSVAMAMSSAASSSAAAVRSSVAVASSSPRPVPPPPPLSSSIAAVASSSPQAPATDRSVSITAMGKAAVSASTFTTKYCTSHIGFCVPIHRNWYFQSFGANVSPYLWHVEVSDHDVEEAGQGVIVVNLVSGEFSGTEGVAVDQGDFVVASRQWTGGRHFEISGPKELKAAVEFMANGVEVSEVQ